MKKKNQPILFLSIFAIVSLLIILYLTEGIPFILSIFAIVSLLVILYLTEGIPFKTFRSFIGERQDILLDNSKSTKIVKIVVFIYDSLQFISQDRYRSQEYEIKEGESFTETVSGIPYSAGIIDRNNKLIILTDVRTQYDLGNGDLIYAYIVYGSRPIRYVRMED